VRYFELSTVIPADRDRAWHALAGLPEWCAWNRLIPHAEGELRPGARLNLRLRGPANRTTPFHPIVVSVDPPNELVLAASVGSRRLVHMVHSFTLETVGLNTSLLKQRWSATGVMVPLLWPLLQRGMVRFGELGSDLASHVATA
jgi:hypothetical protein